MNTILYHVRISKQKMCVLPYQSAEDEEDHEEPAEDGFTVEVAEADGGHGDEHEVHALPVRQRLRVVKVHERVTRILQLQGGNNAKGPSVNIYL